jgi:hypothetical protein
VVIDEQRRAGAVELEQLAEKLAPPCQLGSYVLEGLISRTSTALIFAARGGVFGEHEGVLKLTGKTYGPLLQRELRLLMRCRAAGITGVVRPIGDDLETIDLNDESDANCVVALLLPFLSGGDLVQWIGMRTGGASRLGASLALDVGEHVATVIKELLCLPQPIVYGDVKPQNVLVPRSAAPIAEMTLIDLDASRELETPLLELDTQSRELRQLLVDDVNAFGELLYNLATGREPPAEGEPTPGSGNRVFDAFVVKCLTSEINSAGYISLADNALWRDLEQARNFDSRRRTVQPLLSRIALTQPSLAVMAVILFCLLVVALAAKTVGQ